MIVGGIGFVVDFGTYNLLIELAGFPPELAGAISFVLAICSNFIWNRYWTYPDSRSKPLVRQFFQFFIINVLAIVIRLPIIAPDTEPIRLGAGKPVLSLPRRQRRPWATILPLAVAVVIAMFWNFFANRFWTYK